MRFSQSDPSVPVRGILRASLPPGKDSFAVVATAEALQTTLSAGALDAFQFARKSREDAPRVSVSFAPTASALNAQVTVLPR